MSNPRILIIDDDSALRKTLIDILRFKGFEPFSAVNGAEEPDRLEQRRRK